MSPLTLADLSSVFLAGCANPVHLDKGINQIGLYWLTLVLPQSVIWACDIKKKSNVSLNWPESHKPECGFFEVKLNGIIDKRHLSLLCLLQRAKSGFSLLFPSQSG